MRLLVGSLIALASLLSHAQNLTVSAAASLQNAMRDIGQAYQQAHPGATVRFNFAASGVLLTQISQGAAVDVFASADMQTMDKAQSQGLIQPGSRVNFAANELVLISPSDQPLRFKVLTDLRNPAVQRIALGSPATVPAGHYAQGALELEDLWRPLASRFVFAENVRQALNYVSRAEVQAGFVYRTDALIDKDKVRIDFTVPTPQPVLYPMARLAAAANAAQAEHFMKFVIGPQAQAILSKHGFASATPASP